MEEKILSDDRNNGWIKEIERKFERKFEIEEMDMVGKKETVRKKIKAKVDKHFKKKIDSVLQEPEGKTKSKRLLSNKVTWTPRKCSPHT